MGFLCSCQLPREHNQYVYGIYINDDDDQTKKYINIAPKNDLHWDQHLTGIIDIPKELCEICEGSFEYDNDIDIEEIMKNIGIEYDQNFNDMINDVNTGKSCACMSCMDPKSFPDVIWTDNGEKCLGGYQHDIFYKK